MALSLKNSQANNEYQMVYLTNADGGKWQYIHRIICSINHSKPLIDSELWVNHKDGNKANNDPDNLEWMTVAENLIHAIKTGLRVSKKGIKHHRFGAVVSAETRKMQSESKKGNKHPKFKGYYITPAGIFDSSIAAGKALNTSPKNVYNRCHSWRWRMHGYNFQPA